MLNRIKAMLARPDAGDGAAAPADRPQLAAAALLVEAARQDGHFDAAERAAIERLLAGRFALSAEEVATLVAAAEAASEESVQLYAFTRHVKDAFDPGQRIAMIEMAWEVVYADAVLHDHEAGLLRRLAGLLYVSDRDCGAARKRVLQRLAAGAGPAA